MKTKFFTTFFIVSIFVFAQNAMAQNTEVKPSPTPAIPEANPADVASMDAIIKAVYEVISGEAGQKRDWNRFRSLFYPGARMIGTGKNPNTGVYGARAVSPDDYIKRNEPYFD